MEQKKLLTPVFLLYNRVFVGACVLRLPKKWLKKCRQHSTLLPVPTQLKRWRHWHVHLNTPRSKESNLVVVMASQQKGKPKKAQTSRLLFLVGWVGLVSWVSWFFGWLVGWLVGWYGADGYHPFFVLQQQIGLISLLPIPFGLSRIVQFFLLETDMLNPKNSVWGSSY